MSLDLIRRIIARAILCLYPPEWRRRYGDEVHDLVDVRGVGWRELADLFWCAALEWTRGDIEGVEGPLASARRIAAAVTASLLVAILATGCFLLLFLPYVAVGRWWRGGDPLSVVRLFVYSGWPYALGPWFIASVVFALPAIVFFRLTGLGRRWPMIARISTTTAFVYFTAWLPLAAMPYASHVTKLAIAAGSGWALSVILFPTRRRDPRGAELVAP